MIKVGIDARSLQTKSIHRGIGVVTYHLIDGLSKIKDIDLCVYLSKYMPYKEIIKKIDTNFIFLKRPHRLTSIFDQFFWLSEAKKLDILHCTEYAVPLIKLKCKTILNIYDLTPFNYPESVSKINYLVYIFKFNSARWANKVITMSSYAKNDLINKLKLKEEKIEIIKGGVDNIFFTQISLTEKEKILRKYGDYILYVGGTEYHKNIFTLLNAYKKLKDDGWIKENLVITGIIDEAMQKVRNYVKYNNIRGVYFPGYVDKITLVSLYKAGKLFVMPSFTEGFGLPLLEAMASSIPAVVSDIDALKEIGSDSVIYFDPHSEKDLMKKINILLKDKKLRDDLTIKAAKIARQFSWNKMCLETYNLYKKILNL